MTAPGVRTDFVVHEFLTARINGDAPMRAILNVPAQESRVALAPAPKAWGDGPFIVFEQRAPMRTVRVVNRAAPRVLSEGIYLVKAVGHLRRSDDPAWVSADKDMLAALHGAANRLDALLQGASGSTSTGFVHTMDHWEAYHFPEPDLAEGDEPNAVWLNIGALWTVQAS